MQLVLNDDNEVSWDGGGDNTKLLILRPILLTIFHHNSNVMGISFCSHLSSNVIATKCYTWHDNCAMVACTKFCCDIITAIELQLNEISIEVPD